MCGGQSKRMGTDKGLIPIQDTCWAEHMADKLTAVNLQVSIFVNTSQIEKYSLIFPPQQLIADSLSIAGPLNGLLSVHTKYPDDDLLLLACDMINMMTETLDYLVKSYRTKPGYNYYVYQNKEYAEPFCGIYTSTALNVSGLKPRSNLSGLSLQKVLNMGDTLRLPTTDKDSFMNYNTPC